MPFFAVLPVNVQRNSQCPEDEWENVRATRFGWFETLWGRDLPSNPKFTGRLNSRLCLPL
jgi:hypothetical protein